MSYKKYFKLYSFFVIILVFLYSLIVYIIDPLSFYRFSSLYDPYYSSEARYQLPGFVRNSEFDTLIVGTSMGRNFVETYVDSKLNVRSLNATLPAGLAKEQSLMTSLALSKQEVETVIWEINFYSLQEKDKVLEQPNPFPFHLYDQNRLTDLKYLFSYYPVQLTADIISANMSESTANRDREMLYKFGDGWKPLTLDQISDSIKPTETKKGKVGSKEKMLASFKSNMVPLMKENPDVEFIFFYAPYPITNHLHFYNENNSITSERFKVKKEIFQLISEYPNVKVYDFQHHGHITHNVSNYMSDAIHYYPSINEYIIDYISDNEPIHSLEEYQAINEELYNQIKTFSKAKLFAE